MQKVFPVNFHLLENIELPTNSFVVNDEVYSVPCVFQIWKRRENPRILSETIEPVGFKFVKYTEKYDVVMRRVGVNAGKCSLPNNQSTQSHYFIKFEIEFNANEIVKQSQAYNFKQNTTGPKSISKSEASQLLNIFASSSSSL